jgi:DinB superfamily
MELTEVLPIVRGQLTFARDYTLSLLADIADDQWFHMPAGFATHVAWQVGHLAMAEYGLCLFRVRGRRPEDLELMPSKIRKLYSRGTTPDANADGQPTPTELRTLLERIHAQVMLEMNDFTAEQLAEPTDMPYSVYPTKLGALLFCPQHEMIHAGQIGVLRRLMGKAPVR